VLLLASCDDRAETPPGRSGTSAPPPTPSATALPDPRTYTGDGFSFAYPDTWRATQPTSGLVEVVLVAPPEAEADGFLPNINLVVEPLRNDLGTREYFEGSMQVVSSTFSEFEPLDQGQTTIAGEEGRWMDYRWVNEGRTIRQRQTYLVHGENGSVLTLTATPDVFEEHVDSQLLVESTFRFDG